jgi:hypothetical protein
MTSTTPAQILASAELELARTVTTEATWYFAAEFWQTNVDLGASAQPIVDRILLLEARMQRDHGWTRKCGPAGLVPPQQSGRALRIPPKPPFTVVTVRGGTKRYASWRSAIAAAKWGSTHVTDADGVVIWSPKSQGAGK